MFEVVFIFVCKLKNVFVVFGFVLVFEIELFDMEVCGVGCMVIEDGGLGKVIFVEGVLLGECVIYLSYCCKLSYE